MIVNPKWNIVRVSVSSHVILLKRKEPNERLVGDNALSRQKNVGLLILMTNVIFICMRIYIYNVSVRFREEEQKRVTHI